MIKEAILEEGFGGIGMKKRTQKLTLSAMFLAIGMVLPFFTGQIPKIGNMLLPMHIPVLLCGFICGWFYGLATGMILPILRSFIFGMPMLYPMAIAMAFELAAYGAIVGILYTCSEKKTTASVYRALVAAMICGRIVWWMAEVVLLGVNGSAFGWKMFVSGAFLNAIPGILLQLILIPAIMSAVRRAGWKPEEKQEGEV